MNNDEKYFEIFREYPPAFNLTDEQVAYVEKEVVKAIAGERGVITFNEAIGGEVGDDLF